MPFVTVILHNSNNWRDVCQKSSVIRTAWTCVHWKQRI